jgi:S1-C subfamily serine protease
VYVAAGALALGAGFGLAKLVHPSGASSDIPAPAKSGGVFSEDDDGTGQDNETNIMQSTAPGLVHIIAGGHAVGIGLVLTSSGKVLTTYQPSGGSGGLSAKYVISGKTYHATVLGTDGSAALTLLQMQGAGPAFPTVQVGNSATLVRDADQVNQLSYHLPGEVFDTAVGTSGIKDSVALDTGTLTSLNSTATVRGQSRAGLMQSLLQSSPVAEIGGPLVNLNGQVIGITVGGGGGPALITSYAMPINQALAIARYLDTRAS